MKKWIKQIVSVVLVLSMLMAQSQPILAAGGDGVKIMSAQMDNHGGVSNLQGYYSNDDWEKVHPEGLFVVEYSTYEVPEGGTDPENPEDVYLGIVVYRVGGNSMSSTVTYTVTCVQGDGERYPDSYGKLEFAPQQTTAIAKIRIQNDYVRGGDQLLMFSLAGATTGVVSGQGTAVIRIADDEPYVTSKVSMSVSEAVTDKTAGGLQITVKRTENDADYCTLRLTTSDGTALQGVDYQATWQDVVFLAGQTEQTVTIPLIQSDEKFTDSRYFTVTMTALRGCEAAGGESLRVSITNVCDESVKKPVSVDDSKADLTVDESETLTGSSQSVINVNDNIDRAALLRTVIGTVNGTAVQSLSGGALLAENQDAGFWDADVTVNPDQFRQGYGTGNDWVCGETYTDGNNNLMLVTTGVYDLSRFYAITPRFNNVSEKYVRQLPNTAFGYLTSGSTFDGVEFPGFVKSSYSDNVASDRAHMEQYQIYYLKNYNFQNVSALNGSVSYPLTADGTRMPNTIGTVGTQQKLFYMIYDDEGWDDTNFTMGSTTLHRAVIPFSQFNVSGTDGKSSNFKVIFDEKNIHLTRVQFDLNGFTWTLMVDENGGGGVGVVPGASGAKNADGYGFYVGSSLKIAYKPKGGSAASTPVPQYIYLVDGEGRVHNAAALAQKQEMLDDGSLVACTMDLETLLKVDVATLQTNYYMTAGQVQKHNDIVNGGDCITAGYNKKLHIETALVLKSAVTINFNSIPTLKVPKVTTDGKMETEAEHQERVYGLLKNVVSFRDDAGNRINVGYSVDLDNCTLNYEAVEFAYLAIDPEAAGGGTRVRTNLYDLDYVNFWDYREIANEICTQIGTGVELALYNENTTYIPPQISIDSVGVSSKVGNSFVTAFTANSLAEFLNFEVLHHDTEKDPALSYYTVHFTVSDIYVNGAQGGVKEYPITVYYETTDGQESWELLSFTFKGGAGAAEAQDVDMELLCSAYTDVDGSTVQGVDAAGYKPVVELVDYTTSGYQYVLYIPTYYDYTNTTSALMGVYSQRFLGADGISLVMGDYDKYDGVEPGVICTVDAVDMPYVATYIEPVELDAEGGSGESTYFEEQRQFYTYNDQVVAWNAMTFNWDTSSATTIISKLLKLHTGGEHGKYLGIIGGTGPYVSHSGGQITAGFRIGLTESESLADPEDAAAMRNLFASDPNKRNHLKRWNTGKLGTVSGSVDAKAVWNYNALTHQYVFSQFTISLSGSFAISKSVPIPVTYNVVYASFATKFAFTVSTGGTHVLDYVDSSGNSHYKLSWDGVTITPAVSGSIGVGVGAANLLSFEVGASYSLSMSLKLGKETYVGAQQEFDLDSNKGSVDPTYTVEYRGRWKTYKPSATNVSKYSYGNTLCESTTDSSVVIRFEGSSFQLVGLACPEGGEMTVTVTDSGGNVLKGGEPTKISTYSTRNELYKTLYCWEQSGDAIGPDEKIVVTIDNTGGKLVSLDSIRIYNEAYTDRSTITPAAFNALTLRIAMYIKFCVLGISFSFDPAYMLLSINAGDKNDTFTIGTLGYSKTWVLDSAQTNSSAPVLLATQSKTASATKPGYWNTGEFSELRTQSLLQGDISNTAKTQTIGYHGSTYTFYTVLDTDGELDSFYRLYCSVDGQPGKVLGDEIFVADFHAFIDGNDRLAVVLTGNDSSVKAMYTDAGGKAVMQTTDGKTVTFDTTEKLKEALVRTCVKLITVETDSDGTITGSNAMVLGSTDNGSQLQDSNPVGAATENATCVFYTSASSTVSSGITTDWESFNGEEDALEKLLASLYQGNSQIYCTVRTADGQTVTGQLPVHESLSDQSGAIITITSMDAVAYGDSVSLVYTVELDNVVQGGEKGVLKQIHYVQLAIDDQGQFTCSDTVIIDSVFDYDRELTAIFGDGVTELSSKYYNDETQDVYDSNILRNVQLEMAVLTASGDAVRAEDMEPCLFYQTNSGINAVSYAALQAVLGGGSGENGVKELYDGALESYIIAVSPEGAISLIYNDTSLTSAYTDTLYLMDYCPESQRWSKSRQLTYTDVFDEKALKNHQDTGSLTLENFSAFVDADGKVTIALKSGYTPFSYEYGAIGGVDDEGKQIALEQYYDAIVENGNGQYVPYVVMPIQNYASPAARTDVYMITFADRVTDAAVTKLELDNTIFTEGEQINAAVTIENTGDYMISAMKVSLYYRNLNNNSRSVLASQVLTGEFLSGDVMDTTLSYTVGQAHIPDNTMLGVLITDSTGRITYYDSYTDSYLEDDGTEQTYHIIRNAPELYFSDYKVEIDSNGVMRYTVQVDNCGTLDAASDAVIYFRLYRRDGQTDNYTKKQALFSTTISAARLSTGVIATVSDSYDVANYLEDGELYYAFEIYTEDGQFTTANDQIPMQIAQQIPHIDVQSLRSASGFSLPTDGRIVRNLTLGDEFEIDTAVLAQYFDASDIRVYEIGTNCLSIDNSTQDGIARVKVVALPNDQEGYVKLLISLDGTVINRYLYLHISNRATIDLREGEGWTRSGENFAYAANYDLLSTAANGAALSFDFYGGDLRLYGDRLMDGGDLRISIRDDSGRLIAEDTVSTAGEQDDFGVMLYSRDGLAFGHYTMTIEARLASGQRVVLDHVRYRIDTSDADTTPYTAVEQITEKLDAPLLSGRSRAASFTLTFSEAVELAQGAALEDLRVTFDEYELIDGEMLPTGNTVTFTAASLDGDTLVMTGELSSAPGTVRVYALADGALPDGKLVSANGKAVDPAIPDYNTVTYVLKESGIMSVVVADDPTMPNGSIQKSVQVKFMTAPYTDRLEGTRLVYTTEEPDGSVRTVDFHFAGMTEDPRVAIYRADELTLKTEELTKLFRYRQGIVLNRNNYVLVTADGDYLENDITTVLNDTSVLDIAYTKLRAEETRVGIADGRVQVLVTYSEAISADQVNAFVKVQQTLTDNATGAQTATELLLPLAEVNGTDLVFAAAQENLPAGMTVTYQLLSDAITYGTQQFITRTHDGIAIDPALPKADSLTCGTDAQILDAVPFVNEEGMLCARVRFSTEMKPATLTGTALDLTLHVAEYTKEYTQTVPLTYQSSYTEDGRTTAVYAGQTPAAFEYEQIFMTCVAPDVLRIPAGEQLLTAEGLVCGNAVLDAQRLSLRRRQAADTTLELVPNGGHGYDVVMNVRFEGNIQVNTMTNVYALVQMHSGVEIEEVYLRLDKCEGNTLTFVSSFPVILSGGQIISFTAMDRFADPYGAILDENGTAVSELLTDASLVWNMDRTGNASGVTISVDAVAENRYTVTLRVSYDTPVAADSFVGSAIEVRAALTYGDGAAAALESKAEFTAVENDTVAVYTMDLTLPANVAAVTVSLAESAIIADQALYNREYTVKLSAELPACEEVSIQRSPISEPDSVEPDGAEPVPGTRDTAGASALLVLAVLMTLSVLAVLALRRKAKV